MYDAYHRVFERCGLTFRPVEAQSGEMGGAENHEFMAVAAVGEDDFVWCPSLRLRRQRRSGAPRSPGESIAPRARRPRRRCEKVHTPDAAGHRRRVPSFLGVEPSDDC